MPYYSDKLKELQEKIARKAHLEAILPDLQNQYRELQAKSKRLKIVMEDEQSDVDKLEGKTLTALLYSLAGKKEEKLTRERGEAYTAALRYETAIKELSALGDDIKKYESELRLLSGCERKYETLISDAAEEIKASCSPDAEKILGLEKRIAELESRKKELSEAVLSGKNALDTAWTVLAALDDAKGYGTWDLLGGGLIADLGKHDSLDKAQTGIEQLQIYLRRFRTELIDIDIDADMQVNIDGFLRFADYFCDGLFTSLTVLDRIKESVGKVENLKNQISKTLDCVAELSSENDKELFHLQKERDALIMTAEI